ncbi:hypothetical protein [Burkholderia sp. Ac-20353]|uniref:hypothetical protein n=1 Tax=Burkholderia sp. Ac-20353 TaxID=2703894 RepID=UPI00197C6988|nr:hypothetical protein [Burkholderia sp. Ac-20353]MBN3791873.1 hypothetical protein [Burkholderia sp. Ac-20353]
MVKIETPKGTASELQLVHPDTRFDPEGKYKARITLSAFDAAALIGVFKEEAINELGPKKASKAKMPGNKLEDGAYQFSFKSKAKPRIYDSNGTLLEPATVEALRIGMGSTIRINGEAKAYENGAIIGVTLYLHEVQVIHLVRSPDCGFEADAEGSFVIGANRLPDC